PAYFVFLLLKLNTSFFLSLNSLFWNVPVPFVTVGLIVGSNPVDGIPIKVGGAFKRRSLFDLFRGERKTNLFGALADVCGLSGNHMIFSNAKPSCAHGEEHRLAGTFLPHRINTSDVIVVAIHNSIVNKA